MAAPGVLTEEDIRKLHAPIPGYDNVLNGPCHCPVCDPTFHQEAERERENG